MKIPGTQGDRNDQKHGDQPEHAHAQRLAFDYGFVVRIVHQMTFQEAGPKCIGFIDEIGYQ